MKNLKVFYSPEQTVTNNKSYSPSAGKPAEVLASWQALGLPLDVQPVKPFKASMIALAHDPKYVHDVLSLQIDNGFGNRLPEVAKSLRYTTSSFAHAALYAAKNKCVAASLTSGFHHAGYARAGGFCTFNGLVIAAQVLRLTGTAKKIGIVDIDAHYGDGTQNIIDHLGLEKVIQHYTFGASHITPETSEGWLKKLPNIIGSFSDCDVILYQAGADPHIEDPLGGHLTSEQMRERDHIVFSVAKEMSVPVAWNLAGGYQNPLRKVLDIHDTTAVECLKVYSTDAKGTAA